MLRIDPLVYKLKDKRISDVSNSRMSILSLIFTISPGDYLIFINNTVYALTLELYYAAGAIRMPDMILKKSFLYLLSNIPLELLLLDKTKLNKIKSLKVGCSTCKYNTYKFKVLNILKNYNELYAKYVTKPDIQLVKQYPLTTSPLISKVSTIFPKFFLIPSYERKSCLDCVTKHICMAWIKGNLSLQGYPLHLALCLANLLEAYLLTPKDCFLLRQLLMFCIAKTKKEQKAFVPWKNLLYIIDLSRLSTNDRDANDLNQTDSSFDLLLNEQVTELLYNIPVTLKALIIKELDKLIHTEYNKEGKLAFVLYTGLLGSIADLILPYSTSASNILRNRRIMFRAAPLLVRDTLYDCKDFRLAIIKKTS